jgi:hypothetical protein
MHGALKTPNSAAANPQPCKFPGLKNHPAGIGEKFMKLGQAITPWLLSALLLLTASFPAAAFSGYFYVIPTSVPLRECPSPHCDVLLTVYRGAKVQILERTSAGWSKVRLVNQSGSGWLPSDLLSFSPDLKAQAPPHYYVNTSSLALHDHPSPSSPVIAYLHFNEPVEMLGVASGFAQVRELNTSKVGFVWPRYLSPSPLKSPRAARRRAPRPQAPQEKTPPPPNAM